jgi:hypothetical protein
MKKIGKEILRHGIWIVAILLLLQQHCKDVNVIEKTKSTLKTAQQALLADDQIIAQQEDSLGRLSTMVAMNKTDFSELLNSKNKEIKRLKQELKDMGYKAKHLETLIQTEISTKDSIIAVLQSDTIGFDTIFPVDGGRDTILVPSLVSNFRYRDEFISINGQIISDTAHISYSLLEKHLIAIGYSREKWYKPLYLTASFKSNNPNTVGLPQVFKQKARKSIVVFGPSLGVGVTYGTTLNVGVFVGVTTTFPIYTIYDRRH